MKNRMGETICKWSNNLQTIQRAHAAQLKKKWKPDRKKSRRKHTDENGTWKDAKYN